MDTPTNNISTEEIVLVDDLGLRYIEIAEEEFQKYREKAMDAGGDVSELDDLLEKAQIYREADMNPIFMHDIEETHFRLGCLETFGKRLH